MKFKFPQSQSTKILSNNTIEYDIRIKKPDFSKGIPLPITNNIDLNEDINAICDAYRLYLITVERSGFNIIPLAFLLSVGLYFIFQNINLDFISQLVVFLGIGSVTIMSSFFTVFDKIIVFDPLTQLVHLPKSNSQPSVTVSYEDLVFREGKKISYIHSKKSITDSGKWVQLPYFLNKNMNEEIYRLIKVIDMFMKCPDSIRNLNNNLSKQISWFDSQGTTIAELTEKHGILTIESEEDFRIIEAG